MVPRELARQFIDIEAVVDRDEEETDGGEDEDNIREFIVRDPVEPEDRPQRQRPITAFYPLVDAEAAEELAGHYTESACRERAQLDSAAIAELSTSITRAFVPPCATQAITPGSWVRVQRGQYARKLAYVEDVQDGRVTVWRRSRQSSKSHKSSKSFKDGLVRLRYGADMVSALADPPREHEIAPFLGLSWIPMEALDYIVHQAYIATLAEHDRVRVTAGQLMGLEGTIQSIADGNAELAVSNDPVAVVMVRLAELHRLFKPGDDVKIIRGTHTGSTGIVLSNSVDGNEVELVLHSEDNDELVTARSVDVCMDNPALRLAKTPSQDSLHRSQNDLSVDTSMKSMCGDRHPYTGRRVMVIADSFKGHKGYLKFEYNGKFQVQLDAPRGDDENTIFPFIPRQGKESKLAGSSKVEDVKARDTSRSSTPQPTPDTALNIINSLQNTEDLASFIAWDPSSTIEDVEMLASSQAVRQDINALEQAEADDQPSASFPELTPDEHQPEQAEPEPTEPLAFLFLENAQEILSKMRNIALRINSDITHEGLHDGDFVSLCLGTPTVDDGSRKINVSHGGPAYKKIIAIPIENLRPLRAAVGDSVLVVAGPDIGLIGEIREATSTEFLLKAKGKPGKRIRAKVPLVAQLRENVIPRIRKRYGIICNHQ
ncbi:uncharacterized protein LAESUDRAFT_717446 [Laetiporus sulphureus 93-53]|uniref:KOW domain-containing protein n=1 Tax=Laetiporus sulphureus 93-53 TaxID=1314785 RepID=A0A165BPQ3_9APHY|nr:uncharacterized protein LAESUDRAFT_717446 [Laetiporus sulphureus 93-53]KZT01431.1 hypothetical protein LAESUDRAFT_717446 [Laetiporus sulphureus 93-53]